MLRELTEMELDYVNGGRGRYNKKDDGGVDQSNDIGDHNVNVAVLNKSWFNLVGQNTQTNVYVD